jgi:hypothetical protein
VIVQLESWRGIQVRISTFLRNSQKVAEEHWNPDLLLAGSVLL